LLLRRRAGLGDLLADGPRPVEAIHGAILMLWRCFCALRPLR